MADNMKDSWKETGSSLGRAFEGLGKTLLRTGKKGVDKAVNWAESDSTPSQNYNQPPQQPYPQQPYAQPQQPQQPQYGQPQPGTQQPQQPQQPMQPQAPQQNPKENK